MTVDDNGSGIAPGMEASIFEPFRKLEAGGGMGLGLYLSRTLAELNGGSLTLADNRVGAGASFALTLPRPP